MGAKWRLQRNSSIARDQGLQPDLLVLAPLGGRIIVEVCCSNLAYDVENICAEAAIDGVDQVVAITSDEKTKKAVEKLLAKGVEDAVRNSPAAITVLNAAQCLAETFDWPALLADNVDDSRTSKRNSEQQF